MRRFPAYVCLLALLLTGCAAPADPDTAQESIQVIAMDTAMLITTYGERSPAAAYAAEDVIRDLDARLSRTDPDSEVSRLNAAAGRETEYYELYLSPELTQTWKTLKELGYLDEERPSYSGATIVVD